MRLRRGEWEGVEEEMGEEGREEERMKGGRRWERRRREMRRVEGVGRGGRRGEMVWE